MIRLAVILTLAFAVLGAPARAQSLFERLVMPGDLIEGHAKLEAECDNCHVSFRQGAESTLCTGCHKDVGADLAGGTGFHGRAEPVRAAECRHCHTDHEGREADVVGLDAETFDHGLTDFALVGAHLRASCADCHEPDRRHAEAPSACVECHADEQPHLKRLGNDCAECHSATGWTTLKSYDHASTGFKLDGEHAKAACQDCHFGEVWAGVGKLCVDCHQLQDVHRGRLGEKCDTCHAPVKWAEVRFDHGKDTKFPLRGAHEKAECDDCHAGGAFGVKLDMACVACHGKDDPHRGELGRECDSCHQETAWYDEVRFDHDLTRFPLVGLHVLVPCEECHVTAAFHESEIACASCHAGDDTHKGTLGEACNSCHNPNGWAFWIFDHDRQTDFTLTGAHTDLTCRACHTKQHPRADAVPQDCASCHKNVDVHRGGFGSDCGFCHNTTRFKGAKLRIRQ